MGKRRRNGRDKMNRRWYVYLSPLTIWMEVRCLVLHVLSRVVGIQKKGKGKGEGGGGTGKKGQGERGRGRTVGMVCSSGDLP